MFKVTLTASLLALTFASAAQTYIQLLNPTQSYVTGRGMVKFPFSYQPVAPASGPAMYRDPVVQGNFDQLKRLAESNGYSRSCVSRELHLISGGGLGALKASEMQWVGTLQKAQGYTLQRQVSLPTYRAEGETISGTAYLLKVPGLKMLETYAFYRYQKANKSWVLVCGSGE
ncbi:hypothetical protein [Deinococcus hopiensis]|uniref:DUF4440 domain-containing protein n=1 Tax=Deinococcus hopiensis KR-140 TaxID=695939 RepID=A0A1W1V4R4_9DEIO|nr:hypothetical protein [Deinococcus hopiensis]SMB88348.1 hypothetical protein SAMN00790413_00006 [Deinococcus hopiensis KR-140]